MSHEISLLAKKLLIDDLPGAAIPNSRLNKILIHVNEGKPISPLAIKYLSENNLKSLALLINGEISDLRYSQLAARERELRREEEAAREEAERRRLADLKAAAERKQQEMLAAKEARERDPKYIARMKNRALRDAFELDYIEEEHLPPLMAILRKLDANTRLSETQGIFLKGIKRFYFLEQVFIAHHRLEADFFLGEYRKTRDPWKLVTASGHLRRCKASTEAENELLAVEPIKLIGNKLKSAYLTTHGGVKRDLGKHSEALELAHEAHRLEPKNYRPCTLLGALYITTGDMASGHMWYEKAKSLGAPTDSIKQEIVSTLKQMTTDNFKKAVAELLAVDEAEYVWLRTEKWATAKAKKEA